MLGGHMHAEVRQTGLDERGASFFCPSLGACLLHCTTVQFSPYLPQQIPHSILAPSSTREHVHDSHIIFFKQPVVAHPCTCYVFTSGHFQITSTWEADGVGCGKSSHLSISWFFCFFQAMNMFRYTRNFCFGEQSIFGGFCHKMNLLFCRTVNVLLSHCETMFNKTLTGYTYEQVYKWHGSALLQQ